MLDRLAHTFRTEITRALIKEIAAALTRGTDRMLDVFVATRSIPAPTGLVADIEVIYKKMAMAGIKTFGARVFDQGKAAGYAIEVKEDFDSIMERFALKYIAQEAVRRRITNVSETTRNLIIVAVKRGYENGDTLDDIVKSVRANTPIKSKFHAERIARTETHGAANAGAQEAALQAGLPLRKEWNASHDENTRETHTEADGQVVGMDEMFSVGDSLMMFPGDPNGSAEEVINCRCAVSHIVIED